MHSAGTSESAGDPRLSSVDAAEALLRKADELQSYFRGTESAVSFIRDGFPRAKKMGSPWCPRQCSNPRSRFSQIACHIPKTPIDAAHDTCCFPDCRSGLKSLNWSQLSARGDIGIKASYFLWEYLRAEAVMDILKYIPTLAKIYGRWPSYALVLFVLSSEVLLAFVVLFR